MSTRSRLLLDLGMFGALLVAFDPALTGIAVHEWLSIAVIVPLLFHLIINWEWTLRTVERFAERMLNASRLNLVVDVALFIATVTVMLSGLLISQAISGVLGLNVTPGAIWVAVHSVSANATVALLLVHFALHAKWVVNVARRLGTPRRSEATSSRQPA